MKNYEKPVVVVNEGLAEGVYAASGAHWLLNVDDTTEVVPTEGKNIIKVEVVGNTGIVDDTNDKGVTVTLTFDQTVSVFFEDQGSATSVNGTNPVTIFFGNAWCRHEGGNAQTLMCKIKVAPATAVVTGKVVTCSHVG